MGKIYYLLGKSATGKDTLYKKLMRDASLGLKSAVMYTTRPKRSGEKDGVDYHFIDEAELSRLREAGLVIEERTYHPTLHRIRRRMIKEGTLTEKLKDDED